MQEGNQRGALKVDKGLNTRKFMIALAVALFVFFAGIMAFAHYTASTGHPDVHPIGKAGDGNTALDKGGNH